LHRERDFDEIEAWLGEGQVRMDFTGFHFTLWGKWFNPFEFMI